VIRLYLGFIFFVQLFFSHPTILSIRDFPPIASHLYNLAGMARVGLMLEVMAWIISAIIAVYCIKKYQIKEKIDLKNNGLDWLGLGCVIYFTAPILYFSLNRIFPGAETVSYTLLLLANNIAAPAILLVGFIKVMLSYKSAETT
jgi:hypothetical protein